MYVLLLPYSEGNNYVVLFNLNPSYETLIQINSFADSLSTIFHFSLICMITFNINNSKSPLYKCNKL